MNSFYALAGPPGSGKTSLLERLRRDLVVVAEPARRVLAQQRGSGARGTGDQDRPLFVQLMLEVAKADYLAVSGATLFDRGIPDLLAFCGHYNLPDTMVQEAAARYRYAPVVFWFPAWEEIYTQDDERKLDFSGAEQFGDLIRDAYTQSGYTLIDMPKTSLQARARLIRMRMGV